MKMDDNQAENLLGMPYDISRIFLKVNFSLKVVKKAKKSKKFNSAPTQI